MAWGKKLTKIKLKAQALHWVFKKKYFESRNCKRIVMHPFPLKMKTKIHYRSKMKKIPFAAEAYKVSQYLRVIDYWVQILRRAFQCFFVQLQ